MANRPQEWPEERLLRLAELWPDPTWTVRSIGRELGVHVDAVKRRAKKLGLGNRLRNRTYRLRYWPEARLHRLVELWPDPTWTVAAIARELGVGDNAVLRRAKELGLEGRTLASRWWRTT
jgi:hypothetical protein